MTSSSQPYKPGFRRKAYGQVSENQIGWVETHIGVVALLSLPSREEDNPLVNVGPMVTVVLPPGRNKMNLSSLTVEEITKLREFFNLAFELALPVAAERDRIADDATRNGDDSNFRAYRRAPQMVVREGPLAKHRESVLWGSPDVHGGDGESNSDSGRAGGTGDGLAPDEPQQDRPGHDDPEIDQS